MVGTIFAKLARPKRRTDTILFSKNAVVCRRDGELCICFRVANMRTSHLVEAHVRAILISKKVTEEGENIPYHQTELKVGTDLEGEEDRLLFFWPMTLVHKIDEESPFYTMSARDFLKKRYELILVMEVSYTINFSPIYSWTLSIGHCGTYRNVCSGEIVLFAK